MRGYFLAAAILMLSCNAEQQTSRIPYYDLSSQLRSDIRSMFDEKAYLIKYITYNGKPEQVINRKPDWNKELDPFFEADIHAPSLSGLYTVDSMRMADSTLKIIYKASDKNVIVRGLSIHLDRNWNLISFDAELRESSMMSNIVKMLRYERFNEFRYEVKEDNKYVSDNAYTVIGELHMSQKYFSE